MSYLDDLNKKKTDQSDEQKRLEQINAVKESGDKVVGAVENTKQELSGSLNNLLMATLVAKDPEIVKTAKNLANLSSQIDKATKNIKDSNFKPLADSLKVLQSTLSDIPGQIEQALEAQDPTDELREIANKIGQVKYDPNIRVDVSAPDVDFAPITKLLTNIEKAFKDFKVDIPESDFSTLQSEMRGVKNAIQGLRFPVPNYVLPYQSLSGKSTQVVLDANGNVPVAGTVTVDTTGLATGAKQDTQTGILTTIDADTGSIATSASTVAGAVSGTEMQVDVVTSALPTGAATSAKQDTGNTSLSSIDGKITAVNTGAVVVSSSALPSGAATAAKQPAIGTAGTASADVITVQGRSGMTALTVDGSGVTQPVSGTVTANAGSGTMAVSNAGLTELEAAINSSKLDVNIASSAVASGGTSAADDADFTAGTTTGTPAMGVYESAPTTVTDGDLGTVGITSGRRLKTSATIDAALPAGTNNIGDVDVLSSALPTGAATSTIQTDGSQKTQIVDAGGEQVTVTGGKLDVNATVSGGVGASAVDDAAFAIATDSGTPVMGLFDDVAPDSVNEGDVGVVRMSANRNAYTTIRDAAGNERGVNVTAGNALTVDGSATTQPVSGTVSVTGVSTAANQTTIIGHVDGIETLIGTTNTTLGTIDTDTGNISTKIDTIAGAVSGTEMQVDVVGALPAGTNAIGKLAANSGVDIGDVDVTSIAAGTNAIGRVGHDITSIGHGVTTVTTAGTDVALAGSTACKEVTIQAQTDNTSSIAVGATGVDATVATGTGILLGAGDSITLKCDNLADIYIDSLVNGEGVRYVYLT